MEINTPGAYTRLVKYLYCPKCKDLRVKAWYTFGDKCPVCFSDATAVKVPNTWLTYLQYSLYVIVPALIVIYLMHDDRQYLYFAVILVVVMMTISWIEFGRGRDYARAKVKMTAGNLESFRKKGWG